jgi:glutaminyl-peptide cyclotransferase
LPLAASLVAACLFLPASCRPTKRSAVPPETRSEISPLAAAAQTRFDHRRAWEEVRAFVALGPRPSGAPGAAAAADYLSRRLASLGPQAVVIEFQDETPAGPVTFRNVLAEIRGATNNVLVLAAHYDTKSGISTNFVGANDSGSGVGLLLELGRALSESPRPACDILLAFLDGEECMRTYGPNDGLHGSRHLARMLARNRGASRVRAVIVLDMVGDRDLSVTIPRNSSRNLTSLVLEAAREENARARFSLHDSPVVDDHVPFLEAGMPAVDILDFAYGSRPGANDYWHTDQDTMDNMSPDSLRIVGRVTLRVVDRLAGAPHPRPPGG